MEIVISHFVTLQLHINVVRETLRLISLSVKSSKLNSSRRSSKTRSVEVAKASPEKNTSIENYCL